MKEQLKVCFVVSQNMQVPAWYHATIQQVQSAGHLVTFLLVQERNTSLKKPAALRLFQAFESWWFDHQHDAARNISLHTISATDTILPDTAGFMLNSQQQQELAAFEFDVIYTIDYRSDVKENLSGCAAFGLWYIQLGKEPFGLPGLDEVMEDQVVSYSSLLMRKHDKTWVLYEGSTATVPYSVKNNFNALAWKASSYLPQRLRTLATLYPSFLSRFTEKAVQKTAQPAVPGNIKMLRMAAVNLVRYIRYKIKASAPQDRFALYFSFDQNDFPRLQNHFQSILPPAGSFYADPFAVYKDNRYFIFFEHYREEVNKAHIAVMEWKDGQWTAPRAVLEKPYHLSYPYVFEWQDEIYMIPETSAQQTVELYRAAPFPYVWEHVTNLFENTPIIDASIIHYNGIWWLFGNQSNHPFVSTNDQLFLYYSTDLMGAWTPHPMNPVATQAANCRPAGRLFLHEGKLYRPAQNNASRQYGFGLRINRIDVLSTTDFKETEVWSADPRSFHMKAIHHLDRAGALTVIDGIPAH